MMRSNFYSFILKVDQAGAFPLDRTLVNKQAVVNIDVDGNQCFRYAVLCALHYNDIHKHHHRVSKYREYLHELNMNNIDEPVEICDIVKFEEQNPKIKVDVHYWNNGKLVRAVYHYI